MPLYDAHTPDAWRLTVLQVTASGPMEIKDVVAVHTEQDWCDVVRRDKDGNLTLKSDGSGVETDRLRGVFCVRMPDGTKAVP